MSKVPYWLPSGGMEKDHLIDLNEEFDLDDPAETILSQFLGPPAGYIEPVYDELINSRDREWIVKVDVNGVEYGMNNIVEFAIENDLISDDEFTLGTAIYSRAVIKLRTYSTIPPNAKMIPYLAMPTDNMTWSAADIAWDDADFPWEGGTTEWLPLGVFYVDNRAQVGNVWEFECYDGLVFADIAYVSQLSYPTTMQDVWDEVCAQTGLAYDNSVQIDPSYTLNAGPAGYTCRQVMGFIAGVHGASVKMNRYGEVSWRKFTANDQPVHELTESDMIRAIKTNPPKMYTRVVVTYDEDDHLTYEAGQGDDNHTLYLTNPLMTQEMVDTLLNQINGMSYVPVEIDSRGYPHMELGDGIAFELTESMRWMDADISWEDAGFSWDGLETYQALILRQRFSFKGGLAMQIEAPSISEQESEFEIDGTLTAAIKRLNQNAVRYGKPYYGVTHSRNEGIVVQREDGLAKAVFNADELSFYQGGQRVLYFDAVNNRYVFGGHLQAASGTFTGELQGGSITIGSGNNVFRADTQGIWAGNVNFSNAPFRVNMQGQLVANDAQISGTITASTFTGGFILGSFINGAVITGGTVQTAGTGIYPRIELGSGNILSAEASPGNNISISASVGGTPIMYFDFPSGGSALLMAGSSTQFAILTTPDRDIYIGAGGSLRLYASGGFVTFDSWGDIFSVGNGRTLQQELNDLWAAIASLM